MSGQSRYVELACPGCSWTEVCGPEGVVRWLRKARKLRTGKRPELEILHEVLRAAAGALACPECAKVGLRLGPATDDEADWPGAKPCAACGEPISEERLGLLPGATLCAACQRDEESGRGTGETEYCPRCGAPMKLRASRTGASS